MLFSILSLGLASTSCSKGGEAGRPTRADQPTKDTEATPRRLDRYTIKGIVFAYYLIPAGLDREGLIAAAQSLHEADPKAQLILVDDQEQVAAYIQYAKETSLGNTEVSFPAEWADRHVIANVQRYVSGKWMLCESYGYVEIAELK